MLTSDCASCPSISRQQNKTVALCSMGRAQGLLFCFVRCQAVLQLHPPAKAAYTLQMEWYMM